MKSYSNKTTANFHGEASKEGIKNVCLSVIVIDSVFKSSKFFSTCISRRMQIQNKRDKEKIINQK